MFFPVQKPLRINLRTRTFFLSLNPFYTEGMHPASRFYFTGGIGPPVLLFRRLKEGLFIG